MTFSWTPHRFSGGALALDVANSVILRFDRTRRIDRFADPLAFAAFPDAAERLCAERNAFGALAPVADARMDAFLALRETIDRHFRHRVLAASDSPLLLADLLEAISRILRANPGPASPSPVDLATAQSALRLVCLPDPERLKVCPNCEWLFIDKSRNRSRAWCDMAVCGNRAKARLHYQKNRKESLS